MPIILINKEDIHMRDLTKLIKEHTEQSANSGALPEISLDLSAETLKLIHEMGNIRNSELINYNYGRHPMSQEGDQAIGQFLAEVNGINTIKATIKNLVAAYAEENTLEDEMFNPLIFSMARATTERMVAIVSPTVNNSNSVKQQQ